VVPELLLPESVEPEVLVLVLMLEEPAPVPVVPEVSLEPPWLRLLMLVSVIELPLRFTVLVSEVLPELVPVLSLVPPVLPPGLQPVSANAAQRIRIDFFMVISLVAFVLVHLFQCLWKLSEPAAGTTAGNPAFFAVKPYRQAMNKSRAGCPQARQPYF
jgi:hypothetical protein